MSENAKAKSALHIFRGTSVEIITAKPEETRLHIAKQKPNKKFCTQNHWVGFSKMTDFRVIMSQ